MHPVAAEFVKLFYDSADQTWGERSGTSWFGYQTWKCPLDMWIFQEIIFEIKPDLIVEAGTAHGGSTLFFAHMLDLLGHGKVYSIDTNSDYNITSDVVTNRPKHPRITYIKGSSIDPAIVERVKQEVTQLKLRVLVDLDTDHKKDHVLKEMNLWSPIVTVNSYLIVEDSNVNGHPVEPDYGPGPFEAIEEWIQSHPDFVIDHSREKFFATFNPNGYLKKVR